MKSMTGCALWTPTYTVGSSSKRRHSNFCSVSTTLSIMSALASWASNHYQAFVKLSLRFAAKKVARNSCSGQSESRPIPQPTPRLLQLGVLCLGTVTILHNGAVPGVTTAASQAITKTRVGCFMASQPIGSLGLIVPSAQTVSSSPMTFQRPSPILSAKTNLIYCTN